MSAAEPPAVDRVTVVMVTYNSATVLASSLPALRAFPHVIVVDNASRDRSVARVRALAPHARIVINPVNLGFGAGNNLALSKVETPFALLLNPDCTLEPGALEELVAAADRYPEAALLSARLFNPDGTAERSYGRAFFNEAGGGPLLEPAGDLCAEFLVGTGLLLRMSLMRDVGFFDPNIFLYYEDDDLCLRTRAAGHALVLVHGARAIHLGGQSGPRGLVNKYLRYFSETQSRLYLLGKHRGADVSRHEARHLALGSAMRIPFFILALNWTLLVRSVARIAAVLKRPRPTSQTLTLRSNR